MLKRIFFALVALVFITGCSGQPSGGTPASQENNNAIKEGDNTGPGLAGDPVINRFSVVPSTIPPGGKAKLSWDVSDAASVSINQNIGLVEKTGSMDVSPMLQTAYVITATNQKGSTFAKVTLTVQAQGANTLPVILEFITNPATPVVNEPARLIWKTRGATQVTIDNVPVQASGDKMIKLQSATIFMITATNSYGSEIKYLSVPVTE